mmetsp:Transcript_79576/g.131644  ORF Transcript_79576/g.131644 Transcript_79576/m.131644 type:complete len:393 (-) Transcript_79576:37-1215(-)
MWALTQAARCRLASSSACFRRRVEIYPCRSLQKLSTIASDENAASSSSTSDKYLFQAGVLASLGGVVFAAGVYGRSCPDENEHVWVNRRGPLSLEAERPWSVVPTVSCAGSGIIAASITKFAPGKVPWVKVPSSVHELVALPMAILLAYRFQGSYERWWAGRVEIDKVATNAVGLAICTTSNKQMLFAANQEKTKQDAAAANKARLLGLLDALCAYTDADLMKGEEPHRLHVPDVWKAPTEYLTPDDARQCAEAPDPVLWCFDNIQENIMEGQALGIYSGEVASNMCDRVGAMLESYRFCKMIVHQNSPAPFVVHMRTMLLAFCFFFPFTAIGKIGAFSLLVMQVGLAYCFLGIENVSREMEHPFGDDESDIPCRMIMAEARCSIRSFADRG